MKSMQSIDFKQTYGDPPQSFQNRVQYALRRTEEQKMAKKISLRTAAIALALLLALGGVAYAVYEGVTADIFGWFYGGDMKQELQDGDVASMGQSRRLGDVVYTVEEMVYKTEGEFQGLYGVVRISPAEGANIVLMPEDLNVNEPAGYLLHYGETGQTIADDAPSYAELARQRGAKLIVARATANSVRLNGVECCNSFGESWLPQQDGSILGAIEIADELPRADSYELTLWISNWESTLDGIWLRDESDGTWLKENWVVTVSPKAKGE